MLRPQALLKSETVVGVAGIAITDVAALNVVGVGAVTTEAVAAGVVVTTVATTVDGMVAAITVAMEDVTAISDNAAC